MAYSADDELRALFLEEAGDRLGRIEALLPGFRPDSEAGVLLRRELHALKGASKMMGYPELAQFCHHAEDVVAPDGNATVEELDSCLDRLTELVDSIAGVVATEPGPLADSADQPKRKRRAPAGDEMRVPAGVVDELADRGARLRVVAVAAEGISDQVFRLAALAQKGVGEREPRQVLATLATSLRQVALELEAGQRIFRRITDNQLEALLRLQVQSLRPFINSLAKHAAELAEELGKKVQLRLAVGDARLDRRIVEALREALLHLVRNAVDHGIESPDVRRRKSKAEKGTIRLLASTEGDRVRLVIEDDGRGIDPRAVVSAAVEKGLVGDEIAAGLDDKSALQMLFRAGFSTRDTASTTSGRGMGLDAVAAIVRQVGGDVSMTSSIEEGTVVTVDVPLARRGERVLALRVGQHQLALPVASVRAFRRVAPEAVEEVDGKKIIRLGGNVVTARFLSDLLDEPSDPGGVLVEAVIGGAVVGVVADAVLGEEEVIIHPIPRAAGAPPGIEGITLLASGRPVAVLSPDRLAVDDVGDFKPRPGQRRARPVHVLLVDDSSVTREMIRRLLEDGGFQVIGVGTAEEALRTLGETRVDCMVTDIEMPGMDGLALTRLIRDDPRFADLPIVVVSTLDRPSDRLAGLDSGADAYLTKQGLDARGLVALVHRLGGEG